MRSTLSLLLALVPLTGSCAALAVGAGAGFIVSQEVLSNNVHVAHVTYDVEDVWPVTIETLQNLGVEELMVQDFPRELRGTLDKGELTVQVEAYDLDRTVLRVRYKKNNFSDAKTAERMMQAILDEIGEIEQA